MCDFKKWCRLVATRDEGKVTLSNVYHDCKRGRVPQAKRREFYDKLIAIADDTDPDAERQLDRLREVLESNASDFACSAVDDAESALCSHFTPSFWYLADYTDGLKTGWGISDVVTDSHRRDIEAGRARWGTIPAKGFERAWVTRSEESDTISRVDPTAAVTKLRQKLGLLRFLHIPDALLFEIRYPPGAVDRLAPPTFMDGSTFVVYRSKKDEKKKEKWGNAVDLGDANLEDGFSEAVHRKVAFTSEFAVNAVGWMESVDYEPDPSALHRKMPDPWHDDLAEELEQLLR